ncbi:hypothetical protein [Methylobacterium sp. J-092]|uniref:hypothetical protein n=1 Tax=Methylobacterium sp. J-092 TaxID=2836667 RepID=UPI001FBA1CD2|nr:hypothetical protein [Methylobacterium sp. J-092]MCJ2009190.1 hypothetical protein [Methylobacterium sp. J-092]
MRARPSHPGRADLSRLAGRLGGEVRACLDTSRGFPTHRAVTPAVAAELRRRLSDPNPAARALALDGARRLILGRAPSPPRWSIDPAPQGFAP